MKKSAFIVFIFALFVPFIAKADLFKFTLTANPGAANEQSYTQSFKAVADVFDELDTSDIQQHINNYDEDTTPANLDIDFRGIPINLSMATGSNAIIMTIPAIGFTRTFEGADRDASIDELEDWLKKDGSSTVTKLMKVLASDTATDPVAGNPSSLQSRMVTLDYDYAVNTDEVIEMNQSGMADKGSINANMISIFARYTNYDLNGIKSSSYSLPLAYTFRFNGSKNTVALRMPISMVDVDGSKAYNFGLGLGATYFVKPEWSLSPAVGYTAVGSIDLGSVAQLISTSVTSSYNFKINKYTLTMGNMVGRYQTIPFNYDEYEVDPDIKNTVFRNGLNLNIPTDNIRKGTSFEVFALDTRYFGSDLYVDQYNEVGFSYGFAKVKDKKLKGNKVKKVLKSSRVGFTYLFSDRDVSGFSVNMGFSF